MARVPLNSHCRLMEEENRSILKDVFGESSSSESDESINNKWEEVKEIKGLWLCRDFLSLNQQSSLLFSIQNEGWFTEASQNQAMRFGDLPVWATELSHSICEAVIYAGNVSFSGDPETFDLNEEEVCSMPSNLVFREPLFDQLIVNVYQPGE
ncbi:hypothetical protein IFM89_029317 [Coptis chinensis]|uniref:Uncharacterized protein n=1 Tax=Coptis chinensis TaxID=261450 RepID=A0A835IUV8_9MAGN|nr:hypothetical protein IFM89_029317 [Coptis chinensis]